MEGDDIEGMPFPVGAAHSVSNTGEDEASQLKQGIFDNLQGVEKDLYRLQKTYDQGNLSYFNIQNVIDLVGVMKRAIQIEDLASTHKRKAGFE